MSEPHKNTTGREDYTLISLLNINLQQIFSQLNSVVYKMIIHHDQMGFIPGIKKSINVIHHDNRWRRKKNVIISTGTENIFHKI